MTVEEVATVNGVHGDGAPLGVHDTLPQATRLRANRIGLWLFIASETCLFAAVIAARYYTTGVERPPELNQILGFVISVVLLVSSLTAFRAETYMAAGDRRRFLQNAALTVALGLAFIAGVVLEFQEALHHFPPDTIYGSAFFTLIGLHAFHVVTGLIAILVAMNMARGGRLDANPWPAEAAIKYWHFVDVAWVVIFPTLYLVG